MSEEKRWWLSFGDPGGDEIYIAVVAARDEVAAVDAVLLDSPALCLREVAVWPIPDDSDDEKIARFELGRVYAEHEVLALVPDIETWWS